MTDNRMFGTRLQLATALASAMLCVQAFAQASAPAPARLSPQVREAMDTQRACIHQWRAVIARENRIGKESGVVNQGNLHTAGRMVVSCQDALAALERCGPRNNCSQATLNAHKTLVMTLPPGDTP